MKRAHSDGSPIYPSLHNQYVAYMYVYPKCCYYKGGNFPQRTFSFKTGKLFLLTFYGMQFYVKCTAKFCWSVGPRVLYSGAYLSDCHQIYLT